MAPSSIEAEVEYQVLRKSLRAESMPKHVALFMESHCGLLKEIARTCCELGIKVLSVYTLSNANIDQTKEVDSNVAMNIMKSDLEELTSISFRNDIRVSVIGNRNPIPKSLLEVVTQVEETTKNNKSLHIIEAVNYTGRYDIIQACVALAEKVEHCLIQPEDINENVIQQELETKCSEFPNPDLMIRTGGEFSIDNFMLWQLAYSELYFVEKNSIEVNKIDFLKALDVYQKRHRRFGGK